MDNFGIFKLLGSLYDYLRNQTPQNNAASFDARPLFSSQKQNADPPSPAEVKAALPPLQNSMLSVMSSHDAFVKRVKDKNK